MPTSPRDTGVRDALTKVAVTADIEELVYGVLRQYGARGPDDELDDLVPAKGALEAVIADMEAMLDVNLSDKVLFDLFVDGTVNDLVRALSSAVLTKTAAVSNYDRQAYMRNRHKHIMRSRMYRMRNMVVIRRKARAYRRKVKRRIIRPRKRMGTAAGGYTFVTR